MTPVDYPALASERLHACPLCGCATWHAVAKQDRAGFPAESYCCSRCGLVFITPRLPPTAYAEFYRSGTYREISRRLSGKTHEETEASRAKGREQYSQSMVECTRSYLSDRGGCTLLDVGGSVGSNAYALAVEYGLHATVLEPCDEELAQAMAKGLLVITGTLDDWEPGGRCYDVITVFQTLDHFSDPLAALRKLRRVIADDGLLFVDVVDFRMLATGFRSLEKAVKIDHPCAFTEFNAEMALEMAGFRAELIGQSDERATMQCGDYRADMARKALFVCRPGEPRQVVPRPDHVAALVGLVGALKNGRVSYVSPKNLEKI